MKDRLYLLKSDFLDQGKIYFCPGCAQVEGMLSFYPALRERIEVQYIEFPRPRPSLVAEVGEENQGCPKLVLGGEYAIPPSITVAEAKGRRFVSAPLEICRYLASAYGVGEPH
jgi:hypothetical protein